MTAYVTSINESTTELCVWSLKRLGFDVILINSPDSFFNKLNLIFENETGDFLRVDADVVVNRNVLELIKQEELWWYQPLTYNWFKQDIGYGGIQFIRRQCIPAIKSRIMEAERVDRPESYLSRLEEFHNPRRFGNFERICGLNGYKQADVERVKEIKTRRAVYDEYDFELAKRLDSL